MTGVAPRSATGCQWSKGDQQGVDGGDTGVGELVGLRGRCSTSSYHLPSPCPCKLAMRLPSLHGPPFSRRMHEHHFPTQTTLEGFSLMRPDQWFSGCFFTDPLESLPKFPWGGKPQGGDDCATQCVWARQRGFSRLVRLSGKFALITLLVIQAPAGKFSLLLTTHRHTEQFAGPVQWSSPS